MTAEAEMRRVITHAADLLNARLSGRRPAEFDYSKFPSYLDAYASQVRKLVQDGNGDVTAMAYAMGVLHLLASYLAVEDAPRLAAAQRDERGRFVAGDAR